MEQVISKKHIMKKVIFFLVFIILFNFVSPQIAWAGGETGETTPTPESVADQGSGMGYDAIEAVGGILWTPIQALFLGLGDTIVTIMQKMVYGLESSFIVISTSSGIGSTILAWIAGIGTAVGLVALNFIPVVGQVLTVGIVTAIAGGTLVGFGIKHLTKPETFYLPVFGISPQEIFSNQVPILDVNFFKPNEYEAQDGSGQQVESSAAILQKNVAKWYVALRNFAIVGLLAVLVYIGIRILIGSSAADKAKYKERLMDWLVAMFLLFMMHYIMYFAITLTEAITDALKENLEDVAVNVGDLSDYKLEGDVETIINNNTLTSGSSYGDAGDTIWLTNFMGQSRIMLQMSNEESSGDTKLMQFGYTIIYFVFIIYTVTFLFQYLKRVVYMAFLTMIAPVVALTYPIDKMNDGRAQAFDMWLKEYIFNLLLQPFHLLLYTVLIGTAMDFATQNTIYAIVAIGFLIPAEKLLRRFFGFEKAQTASIAEAAVGGAMVMKGLDMVKKIGRGGNYKPKENNQGKIRTQKNSNAQGVNGMLRNNFNQNSDPEPPRQVEGPADDPTPPAPRVSGGAVLLGGSSGSGGGGAPAGPSADGYTMSGGLLVPNSVAQSRAAQLAAQQSSSGGGGGSSFSGGGSDSSGATTPTPSSGRSYPTGQIRNDGHVPSARRGLKNIRAKYTPTRTDLKRGAIQFGGSSVRQLAKLGGGLAGAAVGATAATIATTASGGKNAVSNYSAGLVGGATLGSNLANAATNAATMEIRAAGEVGSTFQEGRLGAEEYQDRLQEKADQYTIDQPDVKNAYIQEFGADNYREKLEASKAYRAEGITDDKIIMEAMGLGDEFGEADSQKRILVAKLASTYKSEKDVQALTKRLIEAKGLSKTDADTVANGVRKINKLV